jgi:hypothetical protein
MGWSTASSPDARGDGHNYAEPTLTFNLSGCPSESVMSAVINASRTINAPANPSCTNELSIDALPTKQPEFKKLMTKEATRLVFSDRYTYSFPGAR